MKRVFSLLSVIMVLVTGSAFTLVCALACTGPALQVAEEAVSHCHQPAAKTPEKEDFSGPGIRGLKAGCPIMASLENRPAIQAPASAFSPKQTVSQPALLPLETAQLLSFASRAASLHPGLVPPEPGLPLYLKKRVLRI